jgi:hypothetical protein
MVNTYTPQLECVTGPLGVKWVDPNAAGIHNIYYPDATDASIRAAALQANADGGGTVYIPIGRTKLLSALICYAGVRYEGSGFQASFSSGQTTGIGGTILYGDGTFNGLEFNPIDSVGSPPTDYGAFTAAMLNGPQGVNLTFENFAYGVKIGALYQPGMKYGYFSRINCIHCTQWGFWVENEVECTFDQINVSDGILGGVARVCSGGSAMYSGNSLWIDTFVATSNHAGTAVDYAARGICTWARSGSPGTIHNDLTSIREQVDKGLGQTQIQAATMTASSANIGVVDSAFFPVGMPVTFSGAANGFVTTQIYFVLTSAANVITLSQNYMYGTPLVSTGTTAVNIQTRGMPCFEFAGLDALSYVYAPEFTGVDAESFCSVRILMQNVRYGNFEGAFVAGGTTNEYFTYVLRGCTYSRVRNAYPAAYDGDSGSYSTVIEGSRRDGSEIGLGGNNRFVGLGASYCTHTGQRARANTLNIYMTGIDNADITLNATSSGLDLCHPLSYIPQTIVDTQAITIGASKGLMVYATAGAGTLTLPTLVANNDGVIFVLVNPQASLLTLNTNGTQTFNNKAGLTTLQILPNTSIILIPSVTGGVYYWNVIGKETYFTVATLPAASAALAGKKVYVTDQLTALPAWGGALTGGGALTCPCWCTGADWVAG